jgi:hypothetical protein
MTMHHAISRLPSAGWAAVQPLSVDRFHPRSSDFRPEVSVQLAHDGAALLLRWSLKDRYVRSTVVTPNGAVCTDTCVECFVEPLPGRGYFNLEINAGGTLHCSHITDHRIVDGHFAGHSFLRPEELAQISVQSSLPQTVMPELTEPTAWTMDVRLPFAVLASRLGADPGRNWRGNLYHCADLSSHPRWASWADIGERLAFHQPERFGNLHFID